jgi:hypothetical protein
MKEKNLVTWNIIFIESYMHIHEKKKKKLTRRVVQYGNAIDMLATALECSIYSI